MFTHPYPFGTRILIRPDATRHEIKDVHAFASDPVDGGGWRYRVVTHTGQRANVYDDEILQVLGCDEETTLARLAI